MDHQGNAEFVTVTLRLKAEQKERVNAWRKTQADIPSMTEALRVLVNRGLEAR